VVIKIKYTIEDYNKINIGIRKTDILLDKLIWIQDNTYNSFTRDEIVHLRHLVSLNIQKMKSLRKRIGEDLKGDNT
jgi:hypothetical protein